MKSDDQLYRQYLAGDQSAGDELLLRHGEELMGYLDAFLHNAHDAEDLMLDVFTIILVDKPKIREGNFRAYLYKVARNKANSLWRMRFRRREFELDEALPSMEEAPEEKAHKADRDAILYRCLNRIAPQYREALYLVYLSDMSYAKAAEVMGCSEKKIDNMLANGKKRMRQELEKEGLSIEDI
ncbi:MAG: RNA polymerase sigma factor [Firmicutes bacterium]|nr:RNA polymerase sigma factor [Bacillota bacterium]